MNLPRPPEYIAHLSSVVPSMLAAMGTPGFSDVLGLRRDISAGCVLLIDGLGAELLNAHAKDAPTLTALRAGTLHVGFPSTTAAGLAAIGTGCCAGEHGMLGYSFAMPEVGVLNTLRWCEHPRGADLRSLLVPEEVQPLATTFQRAESAGVDVSVISGAEFAETGLTRAVLRGGRYMGVHALGDLAGSVRERMSAGGFSYAYHGQLDALGHLHGPGSLPWRMQLRQIDRLVESIVDGLPPGSSFAVVADHGMVELDETVVDADSCPPLLDGVREIGGEPRARYVYAVDGAADDVLAGWRETLGERAWVVGREEAISAGWFGPVVADAMRSRIGDVVAAARGRSAVVRKQVEPLESDLPGHHGSLTSAEQLVPLLLAYS